MLIYGIFYKHFSSLNMRLRYLNNNRVWCRVRDNKQKQVFPLLKLCIF